MYEVFIMLFCLTIIVLLIKSDELWQMSDNFVGSYPKKMYTLWELYPISLDGIAWVISQLMIFSYHAGTNYLRSPKYLKGATEFCDFLYRWQNINKSRNSTCFEILLIAELLIRKADSEWLVNDILSRVRIRSGTWLITRIFLFFLRIKDNLKNPRK